MQMAKGAATYAAAQETAAAAEQPASLAARSNKAPMARGRVLSKGHLPMAMHLDRRLTRLDSARLGYARLAGLMSAVFRWNTDVFQHEGVTRAQRNFSPRLPVSLTLSIIYSAGVTNLKG